MTKTGRKKHVQMIHIYVIFSLTWFISSFPSWSLWHSVNDWIKKDRSNQIYSRFCSRFIWFSVCNPYHWTWRKKKKKKQRFLFVFLHFVNRIFQFFDYFIFGGIDEQFYQPYLHSRDILVGIEELAVSLSEIIMM